MFRSRKSYLYTPDGEEEMPLTAYGSILVDDYARDWAANAATAEAYGTPWAVHAPQGGRSLTLSFTHILRFDDHVAAELVLSARELYLHTHPAGTMRELYGYRNGIPAASRLWRCSVLEYTAQPLTRDTYLGSAHEPGWVSYVQGLTNYGEDAEGHAWRAVSCRFLLTPISAEPA